MSTPRSNWKRVTPVSSRPLMIAQGMDARPRPRGNSVGCIPRTPRRGAPRTSAPAICDQPMMKSQSRSASRMAWTVSGSLMFRHLCSGSSTFRREVIEVDAATLAPSETVLKGDQQVEMTAQIMDLLNAGQTQLNAGYESDSHGVSRSGACGTDSRACLRGFGGLPTRSRVLRTLRRDLTSPRLACCRRRVAGQGRSCRA